jgi:hypothetical protein
MLWDPTEDPQEDQPRDVVGIKAFKESDVWGHHDKWWTVPSHILQDLYLGTWETEEFPTPQQLEYIRGQYRESVVLVY